jgi:superfamily II DNA/RNA helicase
MRKYQLEALNWLIKLHDGNINGILADEMGLGKTLESISLLGYLKHYRGISGPHLVIVPKSTSTNWIREVKRWCPALSVFKFHGTKDERIAMRPRVGKTDVCVTTYDVAIRETSTLSKVNWYHLYIDEAHRIKNEQSRLSVIVRTFKCQRRLLITGTPLQNNLRELWALLNFLKPEIFSSADDFESWFDMGDTKERNHIVRRLHKVLRPFLLRRLKSEVEASIPPKIESNVYTGLSLMQKDWYTKLLKNDIDALQSKTGQRVRLLNLLMQLRKVCNHPYLFQGAEPGPPYIEGDHIVTVSGKMVLLDKLLQRLKQRDSRVLIFCQMTRMLDILEDYCLYRGYKYCRIDGSSKQDDRDIAMDDFNAPGSEKFVFLLSTRAGGLGINLQTADTVVLYDSDWNPQMDVQAIDRAHRIGQKKTVHCYRLVSEGTVEEKIVQRAMEKLFLDAVVVQQGRLSDKNKKLSGNELQSMVRFGAERIFKMKESTVSDEDIDVILAKGKDKTEKSKAIVLQAKGTDLATFSLGASEHKSILEFQGKDFSEFRQHGNEPVGFIDMGKRVTSSTNYSEDYTFRSMMNLPTAEPKKPRAVKEWKAFSKPDWQFFKLERINEISKKLHDAKVKYRTLMYEDKLQRRAARLKKKEESYLRRREASQIAPAPTVTATATAAATAADTPSGTSDDKPVNADTKKGSDNDNVTKLEEDADMKDSGKTFDAADFIPRRPTRKSGQRALEAMRNRNDVNTSMEYNQSSSSDTGSDSGSESEQEDSHSDEEEDDDSKSRGRGSKQRRKAGAPAKVKEPDSDEEFENEIRSMTAEEQARERRHNELKKQAGWPRRRELRELEELKQEGFSTWHRKHLLQLVRAMEKYGSDDLDNITEAVEDHTAEQVEEYFDVWCERYKEVNGWERYIAQIERGNQRREKEAEIVRVIQAKVRACKRDPIQFLQVPYPARSMESQRTYTEDEDRWLIVKLAEHGHTNIEDIAHEIRDAWQFRFDWFFKSRTVHDIGRRCEYLIKLLQQAKAKRGGTKRKASAKTKSASKPKSSTKRRKT